MQCTTIGTNAVSSTIASSLAQTLHTLLPTYNPPSSLLPLPGQTLPSLLTDLAAALLAQSRYKAARLKSDEEVARAYVCCHIAAERLKTRLDLPKIHARPPCTPKVYKKLYNFLDTTVAATSSTPIKQPKPKPLSQRPASSSNTTRDAGTPDPVRKNGQTGGASERARLSSVGKKRKLDEYIDDTDPMTAGKITANDKKLADSLPDWVAPAIRHLCRKFEAPMNAVPHIFVGTATLLRGEEKSKLGKKRTEATKAAKPVGPEPLERDRLPATVIAVLFMVLERLLGDPVDDVPDAAKTAVMDLVALKRVTPRQAGLVAASVQRFLQEDRPRWVSMEWYQNIPTPESVEEWNGSIDATEHIAPGYEEDSALQNSMSIRDRLNADSASREGGLQIGLGTMMQDKVDWLSDTRRRDYAIWKTGILKKIAQIDRAAAPPIIA